MRKPKAKDRTQLLAHMEESALWSEGDLENQNRWKIQSLLPVCIVNLRDKAKISNGNLQGIESSNLERYKFEI